MKINLRVFIVLSFVLSGCSPSSYVSNQGLLGGLVGAGLGAATGAIIGQRDREIRTEGAMLVGSGIGLATGMAAGALAYETEKHQSIKRPVVRVPIYKSSSQADIDLLRDQMTESRHWGRSETKPWNERYLGENPNTPLQGTSPMYSRGQ